MRQLANSRITGPIEFSLILHMVLFGGSTITQVDYSEACMLRQQILMEIKLPDFMRKCVNS